MTTHEWMALGTWFSGFATFAAVIVALWLGTRVTKIRLNAKITAGKQAHVWHVEVTNRGRRAIAFEAVGWSVVKCWRRQHFVVRMYVPGDDAKKILILPGHMGSPSFNVLELVSRLMEIDADLRTLRFRVYASSTLEGEPSYRASRNFRPGCELLKEIRYQIKVRDTLRQG